MNRRSFFNTILKAGAGCMILPAAMTYQRHWKQVLNQDNVDLSELAGEWRWVPQGQPVAGVCWIITMDEIAAPPPGIWVPVYHPIVS